MSSPPPASDRPASGSPWRVRPAGPDDAPGIARVHVLSWQSAYRGLLPDAMLDQLSLATRERQWRQWLEDATGATPDTLVAVDVQRADSVLGFASGGPLRGNYPGFDCEIAAIYLLPDQQGQGLGKLLFRTMQDQLRAAGFRRMLVWVLASNAAACGFYARLGGRPALSNTTLMGASFAAEPVEVEEVGYGFEL